MKRTCWELQTLYESRYVTSDYVHRVLCMIRYLCVGFAIYNIEYADAFGMNVFGFTLGILAELILSMGLRLELYFKGLGDKIAIQNHTLDDFKFGYAAMFVLYSAAFIIAVVQYDQTKKESAGVLHAIASIAENTTATLGEHPTEDSGGHRLLISSSPSHDVQSPSEAIWAMYDLPMTLTAAAYFLRFIFSGVRFHLRGDNIRDWYVPTNINFLIHRYGEFVMLMMGEGVLSLLIVETADAAEYYEIVISGLLTMIFIFTLKTESEPMDISKHAL